MIVVNIKTIKQVTLFLSVSLLWDYRDMERKINASRSLLTREKWKWRRCNKKEIITIIICRIVSKQVRGNNHLIEAVFTFQFFIIIIIILNSSHTHILCSYLTFIRIVHSSNKVWKWEEKNKNNNKKVILKKKPTREKKAKIKNENMKRDNDLWKLRKSKIC